jgi:hypothetical protein
MHFEIRFNFYVKSMLVLDITLILTLLMKVVSYVKKTIPFGSDYLF